jgi:hypothetical protein
MFHVSMKKGSSITLPILQGWKVTSSAPAIISVSPGGTSAVLTAVALGQAIVTLQLAPDLSVSLDVGVTS